jgi:hypothetical protein
MLHFERLINFCLNQVLIYFEKVLFDLEMSEKTHSCQDALFVLKNT